MKIRVARFQDIPAILRLAEDAHGRSRYSGIEMDRGLARQTLEHMIANHGGDKAWATFVAVADDGGKLAGLIIGQLQPVYFALKALEATDIVWVVRDGVDASVAGRLLKVMHKWAEASPHVRYIRHGTSDAIRDYKPTGRLLRGRKMRQCGEIYEKEVGA